MRGGDDEDGGEGMPWGGPGPGPPHDPVRMMRDNEHREAKIEELKEEGIRFAIELIVKAKLAQTTPDNLGRRLAELMLKHYEIGFAQGQEAARLDENDRWAKSLG